MNAEILRIETDLCSQMWSTYGFTLHATSSGNHYLLMEFTESVFMVRDAVSTALIPSLEGQYKVHARSRDLCQMIDCVRYASGLAELQQLIRNWRSEAFKPSVHVNVHRLPATTHEAA